MFKNIFKILQKWFGGVGSVDCSSGATIDSPKQHC